MFLNSGDVHHIHITAISQSGGGRRCFLIANYEYYALHSLLYWCSSATAVVDASKNTGTYCHEQLFPIVQRSGYRE